MSNINKVAFITEPRKHKALKFVLENYMSILPEEWSFVINHGTENLDYIKSVIDSSSIISDMSSNNKITFNNLNVENLKHEDESYLSKTEKFWDGLGGDLLLKFECDTMLCPNSEYKVSDFEKHDFIGGYWGAQLYQPLDYLYPNLKPGGAYSPPYNGPQVLPMNGALSLRKRDVMIDIIRNHLDEYTASDKPYVDDYFFSEYVTKPTTREVITFSIDNGYVSPLDMKAPFGVHKPWANKGGAWDNIKSVCDGVQTLQNLQKIEEI